MTSLSAQSAFFYYLASASVVSAALAVTRRNPVHSILWVLALFLHVAGIFLLLGAEFLSAVQVIVYAGAILVFYLFVLLLLDLPDEVIRPRFGKHWPLAAAGGIGFMALTILAQIERPASALTLGSRVGDAAPATMVAMNGREDNLTEVGRALFGRFALPFEIAGLILLAAIVGAVVLARRRES